MAAKGEVGTHGPRFSDQGRDLVLLQPVLERNDIPGRVQQRDQRAQGALRVAGLHGKQDALERRTRFGRQEHLWPDAQVGRAADVQAAAPDRRDMRLVLFHERDLVPGRGEMDARDGADRTSANDREPHRAQLAGCMRRLPDSGALVRPQCEPPDTCSSDPVVQADRSDRRKATASAMSAASPVRPSGVMSSIMLR